MRKGATGQMPGMDIFPPLEFTAAGFVGASVYAQQKTPLAPPLGGGLNLVRALNKYPCTGTYCLVCRLALHIMQQRCLKKEDGHLSIWTPAILDGLSNSAQTCLASIAA